MSGPEAAHTHRVSVTIGPVPSASVTEWTRASLGNLAVIRGSVDTDVPEDVLDAFERYVVEWRDLAARSDPFTWNSDVDVDEVRHLAAYWTLLASAARSEDDELGLELPSAIAEPFFDALVEAMTEVLAVDDTQHFADKFDELAPGFAEELPGQPPADAVERRTRVLLVDDTEDIRLLFRIALQSEFEFEVSGEAANGQEAIDELATGCPDVILLDVMMPVMDGMTALPILRERCPASRITVITTGLTEDLRREALAKGATAVVDKQISIDELKRVLAAT